MIHYAYPITIQESFGDFRNDFWYLETHGMIAKSRYQGITECLLSDEFEKLFREILAAGLKEDIAVSKIILEDGKVVYSVPCYAREYAYAGQIALAVLSGQKKIYAGIRHSRYAKVVADMCEKAGIQLKVCMGREACKDTEMIEELVRRGIDVDSTTSVEGFDMPEDYEGNPLVLNPMSYRLMEDPNFSPCPDPALHGIFSGIYGMDLLEKLDHKPQMCVVPIECGSEAVGTFKAMLGQGITLATCEETICQEYHVVRSGVYTLTVRSASKEEQNRVYSPEMADWWRKAKVMRLGCDRIVPVDVSALSETNLTDEGKRAAMLAFEASDAKEVLVVEVRA